MLKDFVAVKNVERFAGAVARAEGRNVAEHRIVVVAGDAGLGKSETAAWWALPNRAVMIAVNPQATPAWVLRDLARELDVAAKRSAEELFNAAAGALYADPRPVVVDEAEHALHRDAAVLDQLRRLVDLVDVPLVLVGREGTAEKLMRHRQIWRRIAAVAEFEPLSVGDVKLLAKELVEGEIADDAVAEIRRLNDGRIDGCLRDLAHAESVAKRLGRVAGLEDLDVRRLGHPWRHRDADVVSLSKRARVGAASKKAATA